MIADATRADLPGVLALVRDFWDEAYATSPIPWDEETVRGVLAGIICGETDGFVVIARDDDGRLRGGVGGQFCHHYLSAAHLTGQELFWRADPGFGGHLFKAAQQHIERRGVDSFAFIALENDDVSRVSAVYRRAGYRPIERTFLKGF